MTLTKILKERNISAYRLSKDSGVPYMTINNLINNKTSILKCNTETTLKIAKALGISVEELIEPYMEKRPMFEIFKGNICHRLKRLGDADFLRDLIHSDEIMHYYDLEWYPECLYLLAMFDYISRINDIPKYSRYDGLRQLRLSETIYPSSIIALDLSTKTNNAKQKAWQESIPEFKRFNIVENEVKDVV